MADTETNWQEALGAIDLSSIQSLKKLKREQDELSERLQSMEELKSSVAEAVYLRVQSDYSKRVQDLEARAAPLKQAAREQYAQLRGLLQRFEADHESVKLDQQELELRHKLGEFNDKEYQDRLKAIETTVKDKALAHARGLEVKSKFIEAFHAESELEAALSPGTTGRMPAMPKSVADDPAATRVGLQRPALDNASGSTRTMAAVKPPAPPAGATQIFRAARLVPQNPEAGKQSYNLTLKPMTIGSAAGSGIRITGPGVDAEHARITAGTDGFSIADLGSKHGTRVNAEKIDQRPLADEDVVQIGAARFVFREG